MMNRLALTLITSSILQLGGLCVSPLSSSSCYAIEVAGVSLPDSETVEGKSLQLNGVGIRKATILGLKVYAAGLYLHEKNENPSSILSSTTPKKIVMKFVRDVSADKTVSAWRTGIESNAPHLATSTTLDELLSNMKDVSEGDTLSVSFGDSCIVTLNGQQLFTTTNKEFATALLGIWLGASPPTEELKQGLLGK